VYYLFREAALFAQLAGTLARLLFERLEGSIVLVDRIHFLGRYYYGAEETVGHGILKCSCSLLTLEQELDTAQAALDLPDSGHDAHGIQDIGRRFFAVIALSHGKNEPVALEG
jgi:hypothetical protein